MRYWQPRRKGLTIVGVILGVMLLAGGGINLYARWLIVRNQAGVVLPDMVANVRPIGIVMLSGGALLLTGCILGLARSEKAKALADRSREFPPAQAGVPSPVRYPPPWANRQPPPGYPQPPPPGYPQLGRNTHRHSDIRHSHPGIRRRSDPDQQQVPVSSPISDNVSDACAEPPRRAP